MQSLLPLGELKAGYSPANEVFAPPCFQRGGHLKKGTHLIIGKEDIVQPTHLPTLPTLFQVPKTTGSLFQGGVYEVRDSKHQGLHKLVCLYVEGSYH